MNSVKNIVRGLNTTPEIKNALLDRITKKAEQQRAQDKMSVLDYYRLQKDIGKTPDQALEALQNHIKRKQERYLFQLEMQNNIDAFVGAETDAETSSKSIVDRYREVLTKLPPILTPILTSENAPRAPILTPTPTPRTPTPTRTPGSAQSTDAVKKRNDDFDNAVDLDLYNNIDDPVKRKIIEEFLEDESINSTHSSGPSSPSSPNSPWDHSYYESDSTDSSLASSLRSTFKSSLGSSLESTFESTFESSLGSSLGSSGSSDSSAASTYADSLKKSMEKAPNLATAVAAQGIIEKVRQYILNKIERIQKAVTAMKRKAAQKVRRNVRRKKPAEEAREKNLPWVKRHKEAREEVMKRKKDEMKKNEGRLIVKGRKQNLRL